MMTGRQPAGYGFWTDLMDRVEGTFEWSNGEPYVHDYALWKTGYPYSLRGIGSSRDFVIVNRFGDLEDTGTFSPGSFTNLLVCVVEQAGAPCAANPCENGGWCVNGEGTDFTCECGEFYEGPTCANEVDSCATDNGGCAHNCFDTFEGPPVCTCNTGYSTSDDGATCVEDECGCSQVCTHECDGSTTCSCEAGYSTTDGGATCIANDCTGNSPCARGVCRGKAPNAQCDCTGTGYEGERCSDDVEECSSMGCSQLCVEGIGAPSSCACLEGFKLDADGVTCVSNSTCSGDYPWEIDGR